jgi:3-hydroxyisobutyrate dehydrogenase-like beta-hydroxyacid dehydrogenase
MNVAIMGSGDMGSAVAKSLESHDINTLTCLAGRSQRSQELAHSAGMTIVDDLSSLVASAEIFLSIMPPAAALKFAEKTCPIIAASGKDVLFVDCNAVSPATVGEIAAVASDHKVRFQDVGIIGPAPRQGRSPVRFYTSGPWIGVVEKISTELIDVRPLGEDIGRASAIKMVYASLTKGTHALRAAALIAGDELGVGAEIRAEWQQSLPDVYRAMEGRIPILAADSARWTGEMREIAETYASAGITRGFHEGAEWIYAMLAQTQLADESRAEATNKARTIEETLAIIRDSRKHD